MLMVLLLPPHAPCHVHGRGSSCCPAHPSLPVLLPLHVSPIRRLPFSTRAASPRQLEQRGPCCCSPLLSSASACMLLLLHPHPHPHPHQPTRFADFCTSFYRLTPTPSPSPPRTSPAAASGAAPRPRRPAPACPRQPQAARTAGGEEGGRHRYSATESLLVARVGWRSGKWGSSPEGRDQQEQGAGARGRPEQGRSRATPS